MKLQVILSATKQELVNEALTFSKYSGDIEAMEYLNDVMSELKWHMKDGEYKTFQDRINNLLNE